MNVFETIVFCIGLSFLIFVFVYSVIKFGFFISNRIYESRLNRIIEKNRFRDLNNEIRILSDLSQKSDYYFANRLSQIDIRLSKLENLSNKNVSKKRK